MDGTATTIWSSGVWLIPIILLATLAGIYLLVRFWQTSTQRNFKTLRRDLRHLHGRRRELAARLSHYSPQDPEPFGSAATAVLAELDELDATIAALEHNSVSVQERMRYFSVRRWQTLFGAPYFWWQLRSEVAGLQRTLHNAEADLDAAGGAGDQLESLAWNVAQEAQSVRGLLAEATRLIHNLQEKNLRGVPLEAAAQRAADAQAVFQKIPAYLLAEDKAQVLAQADKETVANSHTLLKDLRPELEGLIARGREWNRSFNTATEKVTAMRAALAKAEGAIAAAPGELNLGAYKNQYNGLDQIAQNLHATLSRLEVDNIRMIAEESGKVTAAAREMEESIHKARQRLEELAKAIQEVEAGLVSAGERLDGLVRSPIHPLVWSRSRARQTQIKRQMQSIGPVKKIRTPEAVEADLNSLNALKERLQELEKHSKMIADHHAQLLALYNQPEVQGWSEWVQANQKLVTRVQLFDPENWTRIDQVVTLKEDIKTAADTLQRLVSANPAEALDEMAVAQRLEETRTAVAGFQALRGRTANVQNRMQEILAADRAARESLEGARKTLTQISYVVSSNPYLDQHAGQKVQPLLDRLDALSDELDQRQRGTVDRKSKAVVALSGEIEAQANEWLGYLMSDIEAEISDLSSALSELDAVAQLEDPSVVEGRRVLSGGQSILASAYGGAGKNRPRYRMEELVLEFRRRSEYWQAAAAALNALDEIYAPVLESFASARQNREYAHYQMDNAPGWLRGGPSWPPTSVTIDPERSEIEKLDSRWESLRGKPNRALNLVSQMSDISNRYRAVGERTEAKMVTATEEKQAVEALENELAELIQAWKYQQRVHRDHPVTNEEIKQLLGKLEGELATIREGYRQRARNYGQVQQGLQLLLRNARQTQVTYDDHTVLDVTGKMIAYR